MSLSARCKKTSLVPSEAVTRTGTKVCVCVYIVGIISIIEMKGIQRVGFCSSLIFITEK